MMTFLSANAESGISRRAMPAAQLILIAALAAPLSAASQTAVVTPPADTTAQAASRKPQLDFSGLIFANYQYHVDHERPESANKFDVERAYLTFRVSAGERVSVRITTDVFQQTVPGNDAYYRGWTVRAKYAYLQYSFLHAASWEANARIGLLQTVFIDYDERYWPRWIAQSPTDRAGYFAAADAGIAASLSFPRKLGEVYATIVNGPGYTSREVDRFKDFAIRVTLAPFASQARSPLRLINATGWIYTGSTASRFVDGGPDEVGRVGSALDRDRWGIHIGALHPRATFAAEFVARRDEGESGNNTLDSPRLVTDSTGTLTSVYAIVRPFKSARATPHPLSLIARYDRVRVNDAPQARYKVIIAGLSWDLSRSAAMSVDYQETTPIDPGAVANGKIWFAHFVARF